MTVPSAVDQIVGGLSRGCADLGKDLPGLRRRDRIGEFADRKSRRSVVVVSVCAIDDPQHHAMEHDLEEFYVADHVKLFAGFHGNAVRRVITALPSLRLVDAERDP